MGNNSNNTMDEIMDAYRDVKARRFVDYYNMPKTWIKFNHRKHGSPQPDNHLLVWLDRCTSGQFYLGANSISFESTKDAMLYKLTYLK